MTHSYNHFYDNGKCNLQGMKSEKETNYITYHHNWYDHSDSRHPRIRTCSVHSYNNYFDGNAKYGVGVTMGASAFVENNYFRNCKYPVLSSGQGSDKVTGGTFSGETGGIIKTFNNYIEGAKAFVTYQDNNTEFDAYAVSSADEQVPSSVKTLNGGTAYNNFDTSSIMYSYTAQSPEDAKAAVVAKAGRVNGGDFKYDFSNKTYQQKDGNGVMQTVTADEYYHVDDELKALVVNYKTTLVAVGGNPLGGGGSTTPVEPTKPSESETKPTEAGTEVSGSTGATSATKPSGDSDTATGKYVHNFTKSGTTSSVYTITGNTATDKGTVSYAGLTLSTCLKMEKSTSIKFAAPSSGKLILVFGGSKDASGKAVKVNGTKYKCGSDGIATIGISASGDVTITKGDPINLFYINYVTEGSSANPSEPAAEPSTQAPAQKETESAAKATQASTKKPAEATQAPATKPAESATKPTEAIKPGTSDMKFTSAGGFNESIYAQISGVKDSDITGVSYSGTASGELTGQDLEYLVRDNGNGVRIDIPGVKPGTYTLTVTTKSGTITKSGISVDAQDRSGYAHFNYTAGVGAYNDDGSLKDNAIVLYVTDDNKNSVELTYGGITVKGIGNILNSVGKECGEAGHEGQCKKTSGKKTIYAKANTNQGIIQKLAENNVPLVVRFIGTVSDSGLYKRGTFDASTGLIDGLTAYDGDDFGGSVGDNGHMARIKSGRDITLEGIGTDATIDGWGFHFMAESAQPDLGKSFEVRNLKFINTPEDAIGMEGVQASANVNSDLSASVEHCWIHNNEYYCPSISNPAESDKSEGDGSVDFKRGQYFTCSYNYFEGCHKTNLVGSSDSSLQYNLTYHHNYWKLCKARGPLTRNANVHMYNNIYEGQTDYAMNVRANAYIFSEYNLFYMCKNPQRVDSGAIKSYNDSFSSCINDMGGTVVENKTDTVANSCKFAAKGIDYSRFDTDSSLSYIPTGDYELQTSITEAHKAIASRTGVLKENPVAAGDVSMSSISYVPSGVTPVDVTELPSTLTPGKLNKTVYAFTVGGTVDVTVKYADDTLAGTGALVNEAGECFLVASGTARNLPAGTYMIQPYNFQPGDGKTMETGTFKQVTIDSLEITSSDPNAHYHKYELVETTAATCTSEGSKIYRCSCGDTKTEPVAKLDHTYGAWTVTKEATETETGLKVRKCTVCGYEDPQKIPVKGTSGGGSSEPAEAGAYAHNFTTSGTTSSVYTITGSTTTGKGSVTYAGLNLTTALKMESGDKTKIKFTAPSDGKLILVFGGSAAASGKTVKVNGDKYTCGSDGIATVEVKAGEVTITKGDSINLFYMNFETDSSSTEPSEPATEPSTEAPTEKPTETPTQAPTEKPTEAPTQAPTEKPTEAPTEKPTETPTQAPTEKATEAPAQSSSDDASEASDDAAEAAAVNAGTENKTDNSGKDNSKAVVGSLTDDMIPEELKNAIGISSKDDIIDFLKEKVAASGDADAILAGIDKENTTVVDATVMITMDGGLTWQEATEENFPKEGVDVIIPYPAGIDPAANDFVIGHLIAHGYNNAKVGSMEYFAPQKTGQGLKIHVMSASPFVVAWKEMPAANNAGEVKNDTGTVTSSVSAKTGDVMTGRMAVVIVAMIISGSVVFAMTEKKRNNR
ncbi:MAG: hypothetical protein PUD90_04230 [Clostridia bacterium]|nr:hypothetical protein [Clostridia bacterium]